MRIKLFISYLGKAYNGYQKQKNGKSVQEELEKSLEQIYGKNIDTVASGRTDAGVSAINQCVIFDAEDMPKNLDKRLNLILPCDIKVLKCEIVDNDFHPRFTAKKKTYLYNFYISNVDIPYLSQFALRVNENINVNKMIENVQKIVGTYDFTSFCASGSEVVDKVRTIYSAKIINNGLFFSLEVCGNGFLYNMIRIIMGTLLDIGYGRIDDISKVISYRDRSKAGKTVSSVGLVLKNVEY